MLREITIGQYYPANSAIHRLDPRVKMAGVLVYMLSLFIYDTIIGFAVVSLFLIISIIMSKVSFRYMLRGLRPILALLFVVMVFNTFFTKGDSIFHIKIFGDFYMDITIEGIKNGVYTGTRLIYLVLLSSLLTYTTAPARLSIGLEKGLSFLKIIRVPVHDLALVIMLALKFIPTMTQEAERIIKVQKSRGAAFGEGKITERIRNVVAIVVPLFTVSMKRTKELATAMDARCFHEGGRRTSYNELKYRGADICAYLTLALYLAVVIMLNKMELLV